MLRLLTAVRLFLVALLVIFALNAASDAQTPPAGRISIEIVSGGLIVGASGGSGTLTYQDKRYPLNIGGVKLGAVIGLSKAELTGSVYNLTTPSDINGTYGAAEAGLAVVRGRKVARLKNGKGVILELRGRQVGLELSLDLSGLQVSLK